MQGRFKVRASIQLAAVFLLGLAAGAWVFVAPWVVGFPSDRPGHWTASTWSNVWVGAVVAVSSAAGIVLALALALSAALRVRVELSQTQEPESGFGADPGP